MANDLIKYSFTAGELSKQLFGRGDLQQYDLGLAKANNWFVDFRGGLSSRPGFEFCDFIDFTQVTGGGAGPDGPLDYELTQVPGNVRLKTFNFSSSGYNTYILVFTDRRLRFLQDGAYVLEPNVSITNVVGKRVTTLTAHGYSVGDLVRVSGSAYVSNLSGRLFRISRIVDTLNFEIQTFPTLEDFAPVYAAGANGTVARVYTVTTPYLDADIPTLKLYQHRDYVRITHGNYRIRNLIRNNHANWDLEVETIGVNVDPPANLDASGGGPDNNAGLVFTVTAVLRDGSETVAAEPFIFKDITNFTVNQHSATYDWDRRDRAESYNVYRSLIQFNGDNLTKGVPLGFIGNVYGTRLVDSNIIPDFTKTPPINYDPFAQGAIYDINVTAGGSGYTAGTGITATGAGSGFKGYPIVANGKITAVIIIDGGKDYVAGTTTINFGGVGTGAVATARCTPLTGTYPTVSAIFQQRQVYAASYNNPLTLWGSKPKLYSNFDFATITNEGDAYEFDIDSPTISPILHLEAIRGGLIMMSDDGVWQLTGGAETSVTPLNALADPQTYTGVSTVTPLKIDNDLLYIESRGYSVRLLSYNEYAKVYSSDDKSILSRHLFGRGKKIVDWAAASVPFKLVHAVREDGILLTFTFVKEEKVFAWTPQSTKGVFQAVSTVQTPEFDQTYAVVKRKLGGQWVSMIERMTNRDAVIVDNAFCLDCGLAYTPNYHIGNLMPSASEGDAVLFVAEEPQFKSTDVGRIIHDNKSGRAVITAFIDDNNVTVKILTPFLQLTPEDPDGTPLQLSTWSMDTPFTVVSGLYHLEGEKVTVFYDGNILKNVTVLNGSVTLPTPATRCVVGFSYSCIAKTLPPVVSDAIIENRQKRIPEVYVRRADTRGLKIGSSLDSLYDALDGEVGDFDEITQLFNGQQINRIDPVWDREAGIYFVQDNPLPATVLGLVYRTEVGNDPS